MRHSESINEIATAVSKAQATITPPAKSKTARVRMKTGGEYTFNYCDLSDMHAAILRPLADNDLAHVSGISVVEGKLVLETKLVHKSGQWFASDWPLNAGGTPQERGSEITYGKRYNLSALIGIASEDDDDGNAGSGNRADVKNRNAPPPAQKQSQAPVAKPAPAKKPELSAADAQFLADFDKEAGRLKWPGERMHRVALLNWMKSVKKKEKLSDLTDDDKIEATLGLATDAEGNCMLKKYLPQQKKAA